MADEFNHVSFPDEVRRMYEGINCKSGVLTTGMWYWVAMDDGRVSQNLFESRAEALDDSDKYGVKHFAGQIQPDGISMRACNMLMRFYRDLHEAGFRIDDREYVYKPMPTGIQV